MRIPSLAWLTSVKTGRARSKIRHYLKSVHHDESTALGEKMLDQELRALGVVASELPVSSWKNVLRDSGNKLIKEVYTDIGLGFRLAGVVARRLLAREDAPQAGLTGRRFAGHSRHRRHGRSVCALLSADSR
jgi:guanosine-3',5'-bis(diphosphate) 3'-pyrophosphohydrolase